jgi:uncharacterized membrane protein YfcA
LATLIIGISKTGIPGAGILMVPLMANVFGGRLSIGATLPLLIAADIFAVGYYHAHAEWGRLKQLCPWVVPGLLTGAVVLDIVGHRHAKDDLMNPILGFMVLTMLALTLARKRFGDKLLPHSKAGTALTGVTAGFSTMVSNAAGPIMAIYINSLGLSKERFMGTNAWYFMIFNLAKIPLLVWLTLDNPGAPLLNADTMKFDVIMIPMIVVSALSGRWILAHVPQKAFEATILVLAGVAAVKLIVG